MRKMKVEVEVEVYRDFTHTVSFLVGYLANTTCEVDKCYDSFSLDQDLFLSPAVASIVFPFPDLI